MIRLPWLNANPHDFPPVDQALREPDGLLAVGGDLQPERIIAAYQRGIFPWYEAGDPILWWSPNPRMVLIPDRFHCSRSLSKTIRQQVFTVTADTAFADVIRACAAPRDYTDNTWITAEMQQAYCRLYSLGYAHSVEAWLDGELVGGLYGIQLGKVFFGESMFARVDNASKVAFASAVRYLIKKGCRLIDCQVESGHLGRFGAETMSRKDFTLHLQALAGRPEPGAAWQL